MGKNDSGVEDATIIAAHLILIILDPGHAAEGTKPLAIHEQHKDLPETAVYI